MSQKARLVHKVLALCQRRGFLFRRCDGAASFDYGPLGTELKRNIISEWWHAVVTSTGNVHAIDTSIFSTQPDPSGNKQLPTRSGDRACEVGDEEGVGGVCEGVGGACKDSPSLRPQLNQGGLTYMLHCAKCLGLKPPFGIAEVGKVFRDLHASESAYNFGSMMEFDQLSLQFFCSPHEQRQWYSHWQKRRLRWWKKFANSPDKFVLVETAQADLQELSSQHSSIQFQFPWSPQDVESVTNKTDTDFRSLAETSSAYKLIKTDTDKVVPYNIATLAGADRGLVAFLCDAYTEMKRPYGPKQELKLSAVLKLHTCLAPYKVAVLPQDPSNHKLCMYCRMLADELMHAGIRTLYKDVGSFNYRLVEQDEIGTPYRVIADENTLESGIIGFQARDTSLKEEMYGQDVLPSIQRMLFGARLSLK